MKHIRKPYFLTLNIALIAIILCFPMVFGLGDNWNLHFSDGTTSINGTDVCTTTNCLSDLVTPANTSQEIFNVVDNGTFQYNITAQSCNGTDKFSGFDAGIFTCTADVSGGGGGGGGAGLWQVEGSWLTINTTATSGVQDVNITGDLFINGTIEKGSLGCGNITGASSDLCTITGGNTSQEIFNVVNNGTFLPLTAGSGNPLSGALFSENITPNAHSTYFIGAIGNDMEEIHTETLYVNALRDNVFGNGPVSIITLLSVLTHLNTSFIWSVIDNGTYQQNITAQTCSGSNKVSSFDSGTFTCTVDLDTNASTACALGEYLDGDGNCFDINTTIDERTKTITYLPQSFVIAEGTPSGGNNIGNLSFADGQLFNITENSGPSALSVYINFTGVNDCNAITMGHQYNGNHQILLQLRNTVSMNWDTFDTIETQSAITQDVIGVATCSNYISGGIVEARFDHPQSGIGGQLFIIDFLNLQENTPTIATTEHDGLSGRSSKDNHNWSMPTDASRPFTNQVNGTSALFSGNVTSEAFNANDWTNISISQSQITDFTGVGNCSGSGSCSNIFYLGESNQVVTNVFTAGGGIETRDALTCGLGFSCNFGTTEAAFAVGYVGRLRTGVIQANTTPFQTYNTTRFSDMIARDNTSWVQDIVTNGTLQLNITNQSCNSTSAFNVWDNGAFTCIPMTGGSAGGNDTHVQFNNGGAFGGSADLTFNDTSNLLTVAGNISEDGQVLEDKYEPKSTSGETVFRFVAGDLQIKVT